MMSAVIGQLVRSKAGHDKGKVFVVVGVGEKWLCLADGQVRFSEKP